MVLNLQGRVVQSWVKVNHKIIQESVFDKKKKKPGVKFNPGLALAGVRTIGPRASMLARRDLFILEI